MSDTHRPSKVVDKDIERNKQYLKNDYARKLFNDRRKADLEIARRAKDYFKQKATHNQLENAVNFALSLDAMPDEMPQEDTP